MRGLRHTLRRYPLWVGFLAAFVPLLVLLGLQYSWLAQLEKTSAAAHKAALDNYLAAVATEVEYFYRSNAERALNLPAWIFTQRYVRKAGELIAKKHPMGARRLFVLDLTDEHGELWYYAPEGPTMLAADPATPEARSILVACAPWRMLADKGEPAESMSLTVDERDPDHRMILSPITDDASQIIGLAGYVIDQEFFTEELFPTACGKALPRFFPGKVEPGFVVSVRDREGRLVRATGPGGSGEPEVSLDFPFVFSDWQLGLQSRQATPEQWARANFTLNISLSLLLAAVLIGGIALALRTASRELRLSQMKSEFVSNVSHELRTPLASIRVFGELLGLGKAHSPEQVRQYGEYIETESRRLTQLINNILDFSRIESGRKTYQFARGDLTRVVAEAVRTFEVGLKESDIRITLQTPDTPLPEVQMDGDAMSQAIHNLLDNAVKYSGEGQEVSVRLGREDGWVKLEVEDRGIGISREELPKVFDRFHRVSTGLVHDIRGSGLGLSIVKHVAEAHGGTVAVVSEPGTGSVFTLRVPVPPSGGPAVPEDLAPQGESAPGREGG